MSSVLNSRGQEAIFLTDLEKYHLDVHGWIAIPGVLSEAEMAPIREQILRSAKDAASLPETERNLYGGAAGELLDHPRVVGAMHELLGCGYPQVASDSSYAYRAEGGFWTVRGKGHDNWRPHGGGGFFRMPGNSHTYNAVPGQIHTGLTRVVWEFAPVTYGCGGTKFVSGSHKAAFPLPPELREDRQHPLWSTYACPAGSMVIFTEAITHTGDLWTAEHERIAIFCCFNSVGTKFHGGGPTKAQIAAMPPKRQSLFRSAWVWHGATEFNHAYDAETNHAY